MRTPRPRRSPKAAPRPNELKMVREERDSFVAIDVIHLTEKSRLRG